MVVASGPSQFDDAALKRRLELSGNAGPAALLRNLRVFGIACFACIGGLLYGYNQGVFSGLLTMKSFGNHMGDYISNDTKKGWLTSILELGAWVGTLYSGFLAEIISRKYAIIVNTAIFILGVIVQCTATAGGHNSILGGRFVTGMGVGSLSMIIPIYVSEAAPPEVRGMLVSLQQLAIEFGIMVSFWIDYGTNYIGGTGAAQSEAAWLVPLCLQLAPALILIVGMVFMPYSPRWLVHHNHEDEARKTLAKLRSIDASSEIIEFEFLEIKAQSLFEKRTAELQFPHLAELTPLNTIKLQFKSILSLFKTMPMFRRVIIATVTIDTGYGTPDAVRCEESFVNNAILYFAPSIFKKLGQGDNTTNLLATGVVGVVMLIATFPTLLYIDRVGRKPILTAGAIAMSLCHFIVAGIYATCQSDWTAHRAAGWAAIAMIWLFVFHFGWSWGPCAWILVAEVWPLSARPYGVALGASSNWMNNFIVGQVTSDMVSGIGYGTFIFFGLMIFFGAGFIWFYCPETKQLTLEEMDIIFGSSGVAAADAERMAEINKELGLDQLVHGNTLPQSSSQEKGMGITEEKSADSSEEGEGKA